MDFYILISIFILIIFVLFVLKKPLYMAMLIAIIASILLYQIPLLESFTIITKSTFSYTTLSVLILLYLITLLQRMMGRENAIIKAQQQFEQVSNHRKMNTFLMPMFIGLLPSASAIYLAGDMVKESVKDELDSKEQAFVASYYRHVFEGFLPTYSSIIIAVSITNSNLSLFIFGMIPMIIVYIALGYIFYLRKLSHNDHRVLDKRLYHLKLFLLYLSPIILILALIMFLNIDPTLSVVIVLILYILFNRYTFKDIIFFIKDAFEFKVLLTMLLIFIYKDVINHTQTLETLPALMANINIPSYLLFGAIFFIGTLLLGNSAVYAILLPIAFVSVPNAGIPLLVFLNSIGFMAMQISPTHLCLFMASEHFKITLLDLIKKTLPIVIIFSIIAIFYYMLLISFA